LIVAVSHEQPSALPERRRFTMRLLASEMWTSIAIGVVWLAVLFTALFGPDFVSSSGSGATVTRIPSGIVVAVFAYLATRVIAKYGFRRDDER
jgi:Mg/Co/Ni transporter MgtE